MLKRNLLSTYLAVMTSTTKSYLAQYLCQRVHQTITELEYYYYYVANVARINLCYNRIMLRPALPK